jgi:hypothetical protein
VLHASLHVLIGRTFGSIRRHLLLYVAIGCAAVALQAAIVYLWHAKDALVVASFIVPPFFVTIANAFTFADVAGEERAATWLRILERSWAVLIVDLLLQLLAVVELTQIGSGDLLLQILGSFTLVLNVSLVFSDVHATIGDADPWWLLVPRSLAASMAVAWQRAAFTRAIICFAVLTLLPSFIDAVLAHAFGQRHIAHADLWASAVVLVLATPPTQAFCTLVYLDAIGYESKRSCGE